MLGGEREGERAGRGRGVHTCCMPNSSQNTIDEASPRRARHFGVCVCVREGRTIDHTLMGMSTSTNNHIPYCELRHTCVVSVACTAGASLRHGKHNTTTAVPVCYRSRPVNNCLLRLTVPSRHRREYSDEVQYHPRDGLYMHWLGATKGGQVTGL